MQLLRYDVIQDVFRSAAHRGQSELFTFLRSTMFGPFSPLNLESWMTFDTKRFAEDLLALIEAKASVSRHYADQRIQDSSADECRWISYSSALHDPGTGFTLFLCYSACYLLAKKLIVVDGSSLEILLEQKWSNSTCVFVEIVLEGAKWRNWVTYLGDS